MGEYPQRVAPPGYEAIRAAVRAALRQQTQRGLAREIGISTAGLRYLLYRGGAPYEKTIWKLRAWHVRRTREAGDVVSAAGPSAVALLVEMLPPEVQPAARGRLLDALRNLCRDAGQPLPDSVAEAFAGG